MTRRRSGVRFPHGPPRITVGSGLTGAVGDVELQGAIFNGTDLRGAHLEGSTDYLIDPKSNRIDRCSVSFPGATSFLDALHLQLVDPPQPERPES